MTLLTDNQNSNNKFNNSKQLFLLTGPLILGAICLMTFLAVVQQNREHEIQQEYYDDADHLLRGTGAGAGGGKQNMIIEELSSESWLELTEKLKPKTEWKMIVDNTTSSTSSTLAPHQFLHLHHMKTGGTSMDELIHCGLSRLEKDQDLKLPYANIHECSRERYVRCKSGQDDHCMKNIAESTVMSYCAPLKDLPAFTWMPTTTRTTTTIAKVEQQEEENGNTTTSLTTPTPSTPPPPFHSITVLRHPVDRVWSMFRFSTKHCYECHPLLDIYHAIDNNQTFGLEQGCLDQLQNHQVANLLSTARDRNNNNEPVEVLLQEATTNLKSFFTVVGLTEELPTTFRLAGQVFPWLKETVDWSSKKCSLPHANASPENNRCGPHDTHWKLSDHPDAKTRKAIEEHNQLDLKLYQEAVKYFELQKLAAGLKE